jgi:hypothetical protein
MNDRQLELLVLLICALVLSACQSTTEISKSSSNDLLFKDDGTGVALYYSEKESGTESYKSRIFVNKDFLHIVDTRAPKDFLLFNRKQKTIYSLSSSDKLIFVIKPKKLPEKSPIDIEYAEAMQPSSALPKVSGKQATHYKYTANGKHCYDAVSLEKEFLTEVVKVFKEYRSALAAEHGFSVNSRPKEMLDACDLALNIFHATKHLDHGLPIRQWDQKGTQRFLVNYKLDYKLDPENFELPKDFEQYSITN